MIVNFLHFYGRIQHVINLSLFLNSKTYFIYFIISMPSFCQSIINKELIFHSLLWFIQHVQRMTTYKFKDYFCISLYNTHKILSHMSIKKKAEKKKIV